MQEIEHALRPIGFIQSPLHNRKNAPRQGDEDAPDAWLVVRPEVIEALDGLSVGDEIIVLTWFHQSERDVLKVHPRGEKHRPLMGVFATRSPDRPNPIGLHRVQILEMAGDRLKVGPIEAIDSTPVVDIKPVLSNVMDS